MDVCLCVCWVRIGYVVFWIYIEERLENIRVFSPKDYEHLHHYHFLQKEETEQEKVKNEEGEEKETDEERTNHTFFLEKRIQRVSFYYHRVSLFLINLDRSLKQAKQQKSSSQKDGKKEQEKEEARGFMDDKQTQTDHVDREHPEGEREHDEKERTKILIIGAGPSGLLSAIVAHLNSLSLFSSSLNFSHSTFDKSVNRWRRIIFT